MNQQKQVKIQKVNIGLQLDDEPSNLPPKESMTTIQDTNGEPSNKGKMQQNFMLDIDDSSYTEEVSIKGSKAKKMVKPKNFNVGLAIDTDAINELYTYGGEQGKKKTVEENEIEDFESGILELAN